jgi:rhomboid protease GluP
MRGELYRLFPSIFLHADAMHIVMNMVSLYIVGTMVEKLFSKSAYLGIYFASALFGSFASIYMHLGGQAVGASGAIFGLFGALAGFAFVHRNTMRNQFISFMKNFGVILLLNLVIGFVFPSIDISAHVGGLVAGMVGGFMIAKSPQYLWAYLVLSLLLLWLSYGYLTGLYAS